MEIETYTPYQVQLCQRLDHVLKKIRSNNPDELPIHYRNRPTALIPMYEKAVMIPSPEQLYKGMRKIAFSLFMDLVQEGHEETARDILVSNKYGSS